MTIELTKDNFEEIVLGNRLPVLVDFWASWCGPCKMIAPLIDRLGEETEGKAVLAKLNIDKRPELSMKYGIMSVPTLMVFKNGEITGKSMGYIPKEDIEALLEL